MRKQISYFLKAALAVIAGCSAYMFPSYSQQHIIVNKDNTRPETTRQYVLPAKTTSLYIVRFNGYNEIQWSAFGEQDTRRFIAEFTTDGINYQTAGELIPFAGSYQLKHYTTETRPMIYRLRVEKTDGSFYSTATSLSGGIKESLVVIYPTAVRGDVINAVTAFPVERAGIVGPEGQNVFAKELGGVSGSFTMAIPSLKKGVYWITFYGNGWNTTTQFVVAD